METIPSFTDDNNTFYEQFLEEEDNVFERKIEYDKVFLEELINQEDPMLLDNEGDNSILMEQIFNINKQQSNIFRPESFFQANETLYNKEIDECSSESDNEIEDEIIEEEQELENTSELQHEEHIMNKKLSTIPLSSCIIVDIIDGNLRTCGKNSKKNISQLVGTWQIDTNTVTEFLDEKVNLGVCISHFNYDQKNHSNHAKQLRKTENIACNGQFSCNALEICSSISKLAKEEFSDPRYVCCSCFEINGGHIHRQGGSGKSRFSCKDAGLHDEDSNKMLMILANWLLYVIKNENEERKKNILLNPALDLLQDKLKVKKDIPHFESISDLDAIHQLSISSTSSIDIESNQNNAQIPTLFAFQILLKINKFSNKYCSKSHISDDEWPDIGKKLAEQVWKSREELNEQKSKIQNPASLKDYHLAFPSYLTGFFRNLCKVILEKKLKISNTMLKSRKKSLKQLNEQQLVKIVTFFVSLLVGIAFPGLKVWFTQVLASLSRKPKLMQQFRHLLSTLQISGHTDGQERRLEKVRMKSTDPCQRLKKSENIWNLAIIDNIDFKEATFRYGNIFDTTRTSTHTTLRMVFQHQMPFDLYENKNNENQVNSPLELFGMNQTVRNTLDNFDSILDNLLNITIDSQGMAVYQTDFDMANVHEKILNHVEHGCKINPPNIVILEPGGIPNSDEGILESIQMYKKDLELNSEEYLDIVSDEAIF
ncbi:hypothetical protein RhiirC2_794223 [Rhizophagus irregularis]|uniref:Uncharacterized protein n=1 Tax=Rhizophagus irregularis TaxID=588596 RepID=A0A2N1ME52_9GLOM|nr:hypothetical protein RhiirC2_794223 [Rhizophagus irregularis]